ncbi:ACP S-malonyltransferase [Limnochorda pilosa]|uniref:Malonyl CoA-acyl carrier protein transacylase n=1 Tax=Limnochorda pilosa TaxID=1555112 RepID=A0A0K2SKB8_LIMPI|nr:ACP S-malonyltransferase [Limnochorda pilosa]BAS27462.1 malonyl CoA-ACP transacylase [Limnochorda pilosa]
MTLVFLFPGQGSQAVGMGSAWAREEPASRAVLEEADAILGEPLSQLIAEGPEETLRRTYYTQPALYTVEVAVLRGLQARGISPAAAAGHSVGEYAALVAANALDFAEGLRLVRLRAELMERARAGEPGGPGGMLAVLGLADAQVEALCREVREGVVEPATYNAPGQMVVAGDAPGLEAFTQRARDAGARRLVPLKVSGPFHSSLLSEAASRLGEALAEVAVAEPRVPVVANVWARPYRSAREVREGLALQVAAAVRWTDSVRWMGAQGMSRFVEAGPGNVLSGLVRRILPEAAVVQAGEPLEAEELVGSRKRGETG